MTRILIVDDEESNLRYLALLFQSRDFEVATAENGVAALEKARQNPPDIIVSDILMPVMDGFKLCREWKNDRRLRNIPFVFLTGAFTHRKDEDLAASLEADLFIMKPKTSEEILSLIGGVLARSDTEPELRARTADTSILEEYSEALSRKLEDKIRELQEANRIIRESEEKYRSFFENSVEGFLRTTKGGSIVMANPAFCHILGYDNFEDLSSRVNNVTLQVYVDPDDRERFLAMSNGTCIPSFETRLRKKDGSIIWARLNVQPVFDDTENTLYYEGVIEDITARKAIEDALYKAKHRFVTLAENAPFGMLLIDENGNFTYINEMFKELFGYDLEDIPDGRTWFRKAFPDRDYRHDVISSWIGDLRASGTDTKRPRVYTVTCKNGDHKTTRFVPVQLPTGETVMSCEDITEQLRIGHAIEESRMVLRSLVDATKESLLMINRTGRILVANQTLAQRLGKDFNGLIGTCLYDYFDPHTAAVRRKYFDAVFDSGESAHFVDERSDRTYDIYVYPVPEDGQIARIVIFAADITERTKAEKQVRLNESRLQSLYDIYQFSAQHAQDILDYSLDKCIAITGSKLGYIYFYDEDTKVFTLNSWSREVHAECRVQNARQTYDLYRTGIWGEAVRQRQPIIINDYRTAHPLKKGYPEGHVELYRFLTIPVFAENRIVLVVGVANKEVDYDQSDVRQLTLLMDSVWKILSQREAETALRASERKYRNIFENASEGIFQITPQGRFLSVNPAFARMAGYAKPEEMLGEITNAEKLFCLGPEEMQRFVRALHTHGSVKDFVVRHYRKDGNTFWGSINSRIVKDADGSIAYYEGTIDDITDRRLAEERLRDVMTELEDKNVELEKAYLDLKESQKKTIQSEKMASIGQLAAGVAHEINNPTGFVISNLSSLQKYVERLHSFYRIQEEAFRKLSGSDAKDRSAIVDEIEEARRSLKIDYILDDIDGLIEESLDGADRVKKIVQDLKSFSRVDDAAYDLVDIHTVIETTLNIVWNELKYKAALKKEYGEIPLTRCNPGQLSQVFLNILVNAAHAIDQYGQITIRTWNDGRYIFIAISDTGSGIPEEHMKQLFEPFFTTKEVGKGTGLGLSIAWDIMAKHNGEILVESKASQGTTMTVKLPILEDDDGSGNNDITGRR